MPQLDQPKRDTDTFTRPNDSGEPDPFAHLHKMSTTAGLGSGEYVAVNSLAVWAMFLGLASAFSIVADLLLVIPLAGAICAIIAIVQIHRSGGTQTGRGLAWGGLLLSLIFAGVVGGRALKARLDEKAQVNVVDKLLAELQSDIVAERYADAHKLFSQKFGERWPEDKFELQWRGLQGKNYGKILSMGWNQRLLIMDDPVSGFRYARIYVDFKFEKNAFQPQEMLLRQNGNNWVVEEIPSIFPPPEPQQGP